MNDDIVNKLYEYAGSVSCAAVRIYNFIREVGRGELTGTMRSTSWSRIITNSRS